MSFKTLTLQVELCEMTVYLVLTTETLAIPEALG